MAEKLEVVSQQFSNPIKILKWKVSEGYFVSMGTILLVYDFGINTKKEQRKLKSTRAGSVHKLLVDEGAIVNPGDSLLELKPCIHPTVMKDMCAECGADLRKEEIDSTASVPMIHTVPDLKVSKELAHKIGKADEERLLRDRKLVLLVDLDQTLIHTTNDIIPPNIKDVYHFQLYGPHSPWYHTRLRPGTQQFLTNIFPYFELHICTFGARNYAHKITQLLDPDGRFFSNRVLSRDECFNPTSKTANLSSLFPCGDHMVCIIDDREDVWSYATNLIHVKPYHFFQHTGDINAPPGLDKHEDDEKVGVDLTKIIPKEDKNTNTEDSTLKNAPESEDLKENCEEKNNIENTEKKEENVEGEKVANFSTIKEDEDIEKESKKMNGTIQNTEKQEAIKPNKLNYSPNQTNKRTCDKGMQVESFTENHEETVTEISLETCTQPKGNENISNIDIDKHAKSSLNTSLNLIVIDDPDDYLLYLEDILKNVHKTFYEHYDVMESGAVPDLKKIIPEVKSQILQGTKLCFSGLVPTHIKLEQSKAFQIAKSLGAEVTQDLEEHTTHLVAVRRGTAKVNAGRRKKNLHIVTPDWLWACAERWERASEKLFPLSNKGSKNRHPPPHCSSPEHVSDYGVHNTPATRKRTDSGRFMDTINPLMSFSTDDIADMDKEVEDTLEDGDSESEREAAQSIEESEGVTEDLGASNNFITAVQKETENSSSDESITAEMPRGHKRPLKRRRHHDHHSHDDDDDEIRLDDNESSDSDSPSVKFRRGEDITSEVDMGGDSNSEGSMDAPDEIDDGEWNMMGAALEREFLSNN